MQIPNDVKDSARLVFISFILLIGISFVFFACSPKEKEPQPPTSGKESGLKGTIRVSGAWALYPMMVKWGEEFSKIHPNIKIDISAGGAGKGVADALAELVNIGMVSREINPEEVSQGAFYVPVVKDAVFPMINEHNPVLSALSQKGMKKRTLIDLWIHNKNLTWGEVAGTPSRDKVQVYTRSDSCGAAETWAKYLGGKHQEDLKGIGVYGDPGLAEAVRKDPFGIGYNNLNFAFDSQSGAPIAGLRVVPIDVNENGEVDPKEVLNTKNQAIEAVVSGVYPSPPARDLYLLAKGGFKEPAKQFVRWILTDGQRFVEEVGYIHLTKGQLEKNLKKLGD